MANLANATVTTAPSKFSCLVIKKKKRNEQLIFTNVSRLQKNGDIRCLSCVVCPLKLSSPYNGNKVTGVVGKSVNFTWAFSGGKIDLIHWGTKKIDSFSFQDILVSIDKIATVTTIQTSPYSGRVSGVWDGSSPGQATFTLKPIQKADESFYICMLHPRRTGALPVYDTVHLQVIGKYAEVAYSLSFLLLCSPL